MCLIAFAWGCSPSFPLVIAGNRDEYFARPTAPVHEWTTQGGQRVLGGRDLREGGTWAGFSPEGRFAMLTNVREGVADSAAARRSRGHLVIQWLASRSPAQPWAAGLVGADYGGFNLVVGDWHAGQMHVVSNRPGLATSCQPLPAGRVFGLSNAALDTPWPKTERLKRAMQEAIGAPEPDRERLLAALLDPEEAPDHTLPDTGVPMLAERQLSSAFVRLHGHEHARGPTSSEPHYGTRASWIAQLSATGHLELREWVHSPAQVNRDQPRLATLSTSR